MASYEKPCSYATGPRCRGRGGMGAAGGVKLSPLARLATSAPAGSRVQAFALRALASGMGECRGSSPLASRPAPQPPKFMGRSALRYALEPGPGPGRES